MERVNGLAIRIGTGKHGHRESWPLLRRYLLVKNLGGESCQSTYPQIRNRFISFK